MAVYVDMNCTTKLCFCLKQTFRLPKEILTWIRIYQELHWSKSNTNTVNFINTLIHLHFKFIVQLKIFNHTTILKTPSLHYNYKYPLYKCQGENMKQKAS